MTAAEKNQSLLQAAVDLLSKELASDNKDAFTRSYLEKRLAELRAYLEAGEIGKVQLDSAKNLVTNLSYAIDQNAAYDDPAAQFYKAAVGDLKDEIDDACDD